MKNSVKCNIGVLVYLAHFPNLYFFIYYISNLEGKLQVAAAKLPSLDKYLLQKRIEQWANAWGDGSDFAEYDLSEYKTYCETHPECGLLEWFYQSDSFGFSKLDPFTHSGIPRVHLLNKV